MPDKPLNPSPRADAAEPFRTLLAKAERMISEMDLDWPQEVRADIRRRLLRLERAVRFAVRRSG